MYCPCPGSLPELGCGCSCTTLALELPCGNRLVWWPGVMADPATVTRPAPPFLFGQLSCNAANAVPWAHDDYEAAQLRDAAQLRVGWCEAQQGNAMLPHGYHLHAGPVDSLPSNYSALLPSCPHSVLGRQARDKRWAADPKLLCGTSSLCHHASFVKKDR